eukprot:s2176_g8.t1
MWRALFNGISMPELVVAAGVGVAGGVYAFYPAIEEFNRRQQAVLQEREQHRRQMEGDAGDAPVTGQVGQATARSDRKS